MKRKLEIVAEFLAILAFFAGCLALLALSTEIDQSIIYFKNQ